MSDFSRILEARATELNLSQTDVAKMIGMAPATVSLLFNGHIQKPRRWRELALALQIDESAMKDLIRDAGVASLEAARTARRQRKAKGEVLAAPSSPTTQGAPSTPTEAPVRTPAKTARMIPVLGEAISGENGEYLFDGSIIDYTPCPPALTEVPGAYATFVGGELMSPRYKSGEIVWVHPYRPARGGDDVIVQVRAKRGEKSITGFLREFIGWANGELVLRQYSDHECLSLEKAAVSSVHVVVGAARY